MEGIKRCKCCAVRMMRCTSCVCMDIARKSREVLDTECGVCNLRSRDCSSASFWMYAADCEVVVTGNPRVFQDGPYPSHGFISKPNQETSQQHFRRQLTLAVQHCEVRMIMACEYFVLLMLTFTDITTFAPSVFLHDNK